MDGTEYDPDIHYEVSESLLESIIIAQAHTNLDTNGSKLCCKVDTGAQANWMPRYISDRVASNIVLQVKSDTYRLQWLEDD